MNKKLLLIIFVLISSGIGIIWYKRFHQKTPPKLFTTQTPEDRTIRHTIDTSGILEIKEIMKVGSIQLGSVKEILVKENQKVSKDQLLAVIDWAKKDTEVIRAQHNLKKLKVELEYHQQFFARQKALYQSGQLSYNSYLEYKRNYESSLKEVNAQQATLKKATLEYESTKIKAPDDGRVIAIYATKGMIVGDVSAIILFEIAKDVTQMKATLDIDESDIGHVKTNKKVNLTPNSFPDMIIKSKISEISFVPKTLTGREPSPDTPSFYKANVNVENKKLLLRPGMIVNAKINIEKAKDVLSISNMAFFIDQDVLEKVVQKLNFSFQPIEKKERKRLRIVNEDTRFVWVTEDTVFKQKAVIVGITDNMHTHVKSGLDPSDNVIVDLKEPSEMEKLYKKWFGGAF